MPFLIEDILDHRRIELIRILEYVPPRSRKALLEALRVLAMAAGDDAGPDPAVGWGVEKSSPLRASAGASRRSAAAPAARAGGPAR
jgi:hypothetical protein